MDAGVTQSCSGSSLFLVRGFPSAAQPQPGQTRNPKHEARNHTEMFDEENSKQSSVLIWRLTQPPYKFPAILLFDFVSDFDIRISPLLHQCHPRLKFRLR